MFCGSAILAVAAALSTGSAAPGNPLCRMFPDDILVLLTFDDGTVQPEVGVLPSSGRPPAFETADGGVSGRCLSAARVAFPPVDAYGKPLIDFEASGTVICWVRYVDSVPKGKNPAITFFSAGFRPEGRCSFKRLIMMKQGGASCMDAFYEYVTDKRHAASAVVPCDYASWPRGEWWMCAMTWTREKIGFSKNGEPVVEKAYGEKFGVPSHFAVSAPSVSESGRFYQVDEFAVLNRKLTDAEIRAVYEAWRPGISGS